MKTLRGSDRDRLTQRGIEANRKEENSNSKNFHYPAKDKRGKTKTRRYGGIEEKKEKGTQKGGSQSERGKD